jgi:mannose-1-phosphate guanylyltransferase
MLYALIMAGGSGTRFWPVSRDAQPKQLLNLVGDRSLLQDTVDRLAGLATPARMIVATSAALAESVRQQLPELPPQAILGEPCKRDTAPCIGLVAMLIARQSPEATMLVLPSDHVITDIPSFQAAVQQAVALVEDSPGRLVTFGIKPTYAAESFGYLERGDVVERPTQTEEDQNIVAHAYRVKKFREKPKADVAEEYLAAGTFYWNSGIFVWKAKTILDALQERVPETYAALARIADAADGPNFEAVFAKEFAAIKGISIDYAVMEHAKDVVMIEAPFDWDDLGSWQALARQRGEDESGNTVVGRHLGLNTSGTIIYDSGDHSHLIVTVGLEDLIVVRTHDATLVAHKKDEEKLREVVKMLHEQGRREHL